MLYTQRTKKDLSECWESAANEGHSMTIEEREIGVRFFVLGMEMFFMWSMVDSDRFEKNYKKLQEKVPDVQEDFFFSSSV